MSEGTRTRPRAPIEVSPREGPDGGPDPGVTVTTGLYADTLPVSGMTVGEVRRRFADRLNIDPASVAAVDGHRAEEGTRLRAGQALAFIRTAGEKGSLFAGEGVRLEISGSQVEATSPDGASASMDVRPFVEALHSDCPSTGELVVPDGVRMFLPAPRALIVVWELPPAVHSVRWAEGTPARHGRYRERRLAMPYLEIFAVFNRDAHGRLSLSGSNELYFRTSPITDPGDALCFPALLNISAFNPNLEDARALSWICTQFLDRGALAAERDPNRRFRKSLEALRSMVLEAAFNFSSERHEMTSYWTLSARSIPEIADIDRWEKLSAKDPLFVLDIPWLPATWRGRPFTPQALAQRTFRIMNACDPPRDSADGLARIVFNHVGNRTCQVAATGS